MIDLTRTTYPELRTLAFQLTHCVKGQRWKRLKDGVVVTLTTSLVETPMPWYWKDGAKRNASGKTWFNFLSEHSPEEVKEATRGT